MTRRTAAKAALGLLFSSSAYATVFDTYGQSAGTIAIGNATTAGGTTTFAAYTNPALLINAKKNEISVQATVTQFHLQDIPDAPGSNLSADKDRPSNADDLTGNSVGMNFTLTEGLHLGIAAYMPAGTFGNIKGVSPYQTTYLRFDEAQGKPAIYSAVGIELPAGFSIGLGAYYSLRAKGVIQIALSADESEGRVDLNMEPVIAPYGGLAWTYGGYTLGAYYRDAQKTDSKIDASFQLVNEDSTLPFNATTSLIPFYDPAMFRFGAAGTFGETQLLFSFEQAAWSRFRTPLVALSGNDVAAISSEAAHRSANLRDTQAYRLGTIVPLHLIDHHDIDFRAGLEFHTSANRPHTKSPVVDPARQNAALGLVWKLPADSKERRLGIEAAYQYANLSAVDRESAKGTPIHLEAGHSIQTFVGGLDYEL